MAWFDGFFLDPLRFEGFRLVSRVFSSSPAHRKARVLWGLIR